MAADAYQIARRLLEELGPDPSLASVLAELAPAPQRGDRAAENPDARSNGAEDSALAASAVVSQELP